MSASDWLQLLLHFLTLSLLAVGGAITTAPDMHRFLVDQRHWMTDPQFSSSIAIAQAAPGPNVLFVALMGWNVGLNAGGGAGGGVPAYALALLGAAITMFGMMLPSGVLTYAATRWAHRNRELRGVRAFKAGMAPLVVALLLSAGWVLASGQHSPAGNWRLWLLTAVAALIVWRTRIHLLWLIGAGALLGVMGWI
ncbi:MAG: chromate transporter [Burkholderiaceae bacterium]|jgi:chromate transporter|nr:chromate transporter [Burkholderiaceae bacterium]